MRDDGIGAAAEEKTKLVSKHSTRLKIRSSTGKTRSRLQEEMLSKPIWKGWWRPGAAAGSGATV